MGYVIKYRNSDELIIDESIAKELSSYVKEYYILGAVLYKAEVIRKNRLVFVNYENHHKDFKDKLKEHINIYGDNIPADFIESKEATEEGYKVRTYLYKKGILDFVRDIYYNQKGMVLREVTLDYHDNYKPKSMECYEYDENDELIGVTQKFMDGTVFGHIDFE